MNRTRSCEGIFCEELIEIESNPQPCLICEDGFEANEDDTECIDVNECVDDSACPLNSLCTNTEGSFTCECEDGLFGDDYNFCIEQRACHPAGEGDCDCQALDLANSTFITNIWNSTDSNCFYEISVQLPQFDVNSWKVNIDWTSQMSIHGLWRAQTDEAKATTHELQATYFNVDEMMDFTIQIKSEIACSLENPVNELILCTEEIEKTESTAVESTTMELMTTGKKIVEMENLKIKKKIIINFRIFFRKNLIKIFSCWRAIDFLNNFGTAPKSFGRILRSCFF